MQNHRGEDARGGKTVPFRSERGREQAKRARRGMRGRTRGLPRNRLIWFCNNLAQRRTCDAKLDVYDADMSFRAQRGISSACGVGRTLCCAFASDFHLDGSCDDTREIPRFARNDRPRATHFASCMKKREERLSPLRQNSHRQYLSRSLQFGLQRMHPISPLQRTRNLRVLTSRRPVTSEHRCYLLRCPLPAQPSRPS